MHMSAFACMHMCVLFGSLVQVQVGERDRPLELELQIVTAILLVLETKPYLLEEQPMLLPADPSL